MNSSTIFLACLLQAAPGLLQADGPQAAPVQKQIVLARSYLSIGDYASAERRLRLAMASAGSDPEAYRTVQVALADLLREESRPAEARDIYEEVLASEQITARQRFDALAGVADIDAGNGNTDTSAGEWEAALTIARDENNSSMEADALRGLGTAWLDGGNPARAQPLLVQSLHMLENDPKSPPGAIASGLTSLGRCYRLRNKLVLAEDVFLRALELNRRAFGETHPQVGIVMERLAEVYALLKHFDVAREYSMRALVLMRASCGERSAPAAVALVNRAVIEQQAGALEASAGNFAAALQIIRDSPDNTVLEQRIIDRYVVVLKAEHRDREARELTAIARGAGNSHGTKD